MSSQNEIKLQSSTDQIKVQTSIDLAKSNSATNKLKTFDCEDVAQRLIDNLQAHKVNMNLNTNALISRFLILDLLDVGFGIRIEWSDAAYYSVRFNYYGRDYGLTFLDDLGFANLICLRSRYAEIVSYVDIGFDENNFVSIQYRSVVFCLVNQMFEKFYKGLLVHAEKLTEVPRRINVFHI